MSEFYLRTISRWTLSSCIVTGLTLFAQPLLAQTQISIELLDKATGGKVPARIEYTQPAGRGPKPKKGLAAGRYNLFEAPALLSPAPGRYEFMVRRGPEFQDVRTGFTLDRNAKDIVEVVIPHKTPMRLFGWYSGDLRCDLHPPELRRWMDAESLDIASTSDSVANLNNEPARKSETTEPQDSMLMPAPPTAPLDARGQPDWTSTPSPAPLLHIDGGRLQIDAPENGGIQIHRYQELVAQSPELALTSENKPDNNKPFNKSSTPAIVDWLSKLPANSIAHIELTRPWQRDVPLLLATEKMDSIQLLSEILKPNSAKAISKEIRNPDSLRFKGTKGLGRLSEFIYWQMLEAGLYLPASAGSNFNNQGDTYLGYNRVYVFLEPGMTRNADSWWKQLRRGATTVTNGPLIRPTINDLRPGSIQSSQRDQPIHLNIELDLTVRDPVEYLDVIYNGKTLYQARLEDHSKRGQFPPLNISESGWVVIRVVTEYESSYRLTTTSPFYFEFDGQRRVSLKGVKFFQDWLSDVEKEIQNHPDIANDYESLLANAKTFWSSREKQANAK